MIAELVNNDAGGDSQEARIAYLRERGVEIEFPEDRQKEGTQSQQANSEEATTTTRKVYLVKIPCDDREPLTEIQLPVSDSESKSGDQLLELLRIFFRSKKYESPGVVAELRKTTPTYFGNADVSVSDETLQNLTLQGNVEAFALTRPSESSGYCGVTLYLDEVGQLKKLPLNRRAAAIAADCGYDNVPLVGDMFVARSRMAPPSSSSSSSGKMRHEDFRLADLDSSQQWIRTAKADNYNAAAAVGRISMEGGGEPDGSPQTGQDREGRSYRWRESPDGVSVDVTLPLPAETTSKQLAVTFRTSALTVKTKTGTVLLHIDPLAAACDPDDCTWTFTAGDAPEMELSLIKAEAGKSWGSLERK